MTHRLLAQPTQSRAANPAPRRVRSRVANPARRRADSRVGSLCSSFVCACARWGRGVEGS